MRKLLFVFKSRGKGGRFQVTCVIHLLTIESDNYVTLCQQILYCRVLLVCFCRVSTSHEGFEGTAIPSFSIPDQGMKTIEWNNLIVPATVPVGDKVELTLTVKRMDNTVASQVRSRNRYT